MNNLELIDSNLSTHKERRRKLLPIWIKIFLWLFMIGGILAPIGLVLGLLGFNFQLALYGLETTNALSMVGLLLILFFIIKAIVSLGLWIEKDWAVNLAIMDAIIGIIACLVVMFVFPFFSASGVFTVNIRLELIALIPYLIKMVKIKGEWQNRK